MPFRGIRRGPCVHARVINATIAPLMARRVTKKKSSPRRRYCPPNTFPDVTAKLGTVQLTSGEGLILDIS
jgi:hypothetical protein